MPKKIFTQELEGTRRRGRPRKGWKEEVERDLQVLGVRRWRELVADRKKMEGHCSTGQSPQWAVLPTEEGEEGEEEGKEEEGEGEGGGGGGEEGEGGGGEEEEEEEEEEGGGGGGGEEEEEEGKEGKEE